MSAKVNEIFVLLVQFFLRKILCAPCVLCGQIILEAYERKPTRFPSN